ncbi:50S ribosomal protein L11 methyltransferase [Erythrobacter sp. JK5]|uniref:50S ribosomal protein L11 methyltransferase n=1 Tax=Erythrobacter sp. JK5 TaxID=2829500 RepID=UPI001BA5865D|nr:50S ribosomal protein L11 methyltransferase [Erythrobacter sp. JK5]QUL38542.1 50S ribosomal protein L11 methyltransferase [Erythrobacter sp. JK5]
MTEISWKLTAHAPKKVVQAALLAHDEIEDWEPELVIAGRELSEDRPEEWVLEAWYPREPGAAQTDALSGLFGKSAPTFECAELPSADWVELSQQGAQPIRAGPFCVRTPGFEPDPQAINFLIPAAQAFGTGQHQTTAGCLEMLGRLKRTGALARDIADIGTGTGLLGFAALSLWPRARVTASDIDPVCAPVVEENAALNRVALGPQPGALVMTIADGMADPLLEMRGPYDLLIANILAGPLIEMARDFAAAVHPGGNIVLSGLLAEQQEADVRRAYRRAGFRFVSRIQNDDWSVLWLRRRRRGR